MTAGPQGEGAAGGAWDAVVYRPPRRPGAPGLPDLADAGAFFAAHAQAFGDAAGRRPPRLVLISSAAAGSPSHPSTGFVQESQVPPGSNPIARAWLRLQALAAAGPGSLAGAPAPEANALRPAAPGAPDRGSRPG